jgi:glucosamine--fructose-6-phosphate aminotransferase (isomerizing)
MCGIVGYIGEKQSAEVLLDGLSKLEYRGYDSAGIAVFENDVVSVVKTKGKLNNLKKKLKEDGAPIGTCGIGHTRWATHGEPSNVNSHPHSGGRVTIVHNGIIENYSTLKEELIKKGYSFLSDTDTEVAARLLDYYYDGEPLNAITAAIARFRGSYALGMLFSDYPDRIYAVRKDSPLIVGLGKGENFIASDIPAILKYTREYYLLEENEIAVITKDTVDICDIAGNAIEKEKMIATWDVEAAEKGGFDHFMLKEIFDQPKALRDTISPRLVDGLPLLDFGTTASGGFEDVERVHIVACGSAMHVGMVGKNAIEQLSRIPTEVDVASEFRYRNPVFGKNDLVVIISQSGETADTLAAQRLAKTHGVKTLAVVNVVGSSIAREADRVIYTWAGSEIAVATTKAYSVQMAVLQLLAIRLGLDKGTLSKEAARNLCSYIEKLPEAVNKLLEQKEKCHELAKVYYKANNIFFIGRGMDYAVSMEGSLKLKEISYIHSEAYPAGELKHGTISLIVKDRPVVAIATQKDLVEKTISNIKEVKARGAKILLVTRESEHIDAEIANDTILLPEFPDILMPSLAIIPLQMFAYYMAVERECNVDQPRNLAKSVTVE